MIRVPAMLLQTMILVHMVDGKEVAINAEFVTSMAAPGSLITDKSKCNIHFTNGHFINTLETCDEVGLLWQHEDAKVK